MRSSIFIGAAGLIVIGINEVARGEGIPALNFNTSQVEVVKTIFRGIDLKKGDNITLFIKRAIEENYNLPLSGRFTREEIQGQLNRLYDIGYLSAIEVTLEPTSNSNEFILVYDVEINPEIERVEFSGLTLPPVDFAVNLFSDMPVGLLDNRELAKRVIFLEDWYRQRGYTLAKVVDRSVIDKVLVLNVVEGELSDIDFQFFDDQGRRIKGRTHLSIILRELSLLPGQVYNQVLANRDSSVLNNFEIFRQVRPQLVPDPKDARRYILRYFITERRSRSFNLGANITPGVGPGLSLEVSDKNLGGLRQSLSLDLRFSGAEEFSGSFRFRNPWLGRNPYRLGLGLGGSLGLTGANALEGGQIFVPTEIGGKAITRRLAFDLSFPFRLPDRLWFFVPKLNLERVTVLSSRGLQPVRRDILGNPLTASGTSGDFLATVGFRAVRDTRNSDFLATSGSLLDFNFKQGLGFDKINFGSIVLDGSYYFPTPGIRWGNRVGALALGGSVGLSYGNLPPYEAFILGGSQTVRGWATSAIASAKNYILGTVEYRIPLPLNLYGVIFFDAASALGSQNAVIGKPGVVRNKPGFGLGYGIGLRFLDQRVGIDWGFNNRGTSDVILNANFRF